MTLFRSSGGDTGVLGGLDFSKSWLRFAQRCNEIGLLGRVSQITHSCHAIKRSNKCSCQISAVNLAKRALSSFSESLKGVVKTVSCRYAAEPPPIWSAAPPFQSLPKTRFLTTKRFKVQLPMHNAISKVIKDKERLLHFAIRKYDAFLWSQTCDHYSSFVISISPISKHNSFPCSHKFTTTDYHVWSGKFQARRQRNDGML